MNKPKNWDSLSPVEQKAFQEKAREYQRKWRNANPEKAQEINRKSNRKWREVNPEKNRESVRKWCEANPEKAQKSNRKAKQKSKQQTAADQFFIMAGAAEQLTKLKPKQ